MKKVFFAVAVAAVALLGFTGCGETVSKDVSVSAIAYFGGSLPKAMTLKSDVEAIFMSEMKAAGAVEFATEPTILIFKAQSSEASVKKTILDAAAKADKNVKTKYGDGTTMIVPDYMDYLRITVFYNWEAQPTEAVTYTYKEKKTE